MCVFVCVGARLNLLYNETRMNYKCIQNDLYLFEKPGLHSVFLYLDERAATYNVRTQLLWGCIKLHTQ